jgi:FixJ family two-component response regulator
MLTPMTANESRPLVTVIDDDESVRESLPDLLREFGVTVQTFDSAEGFLSKGDLHQTSCLILDVAMPGISGPQLQQELYRRGIRIPIVFITAHADTLTRAKLLNSGAVDCLLKPFGDQELRSALDRALARN